MTTTNRAGAPVDRLGFEAVEHIVLFGASGDTLSGTLKTDVKLEASEDGSNWDAVTDARHVLGAMPDENGIFATVDSDETAQNEYRVGYVGDARYSRVSLLLTGTHSNGTPVSALAVLGAALVKPTA